MPYRLHRFTILTPLRASPFLLSACSYPSPHAMPILYNAPHHTRTVPSPLLPRITLPLPASPYLRRPRLTRTAGARLLPRIAAPRHFTHALRYLLHTARFYHAAALRSRARRAHARHALHTAARTASCSAHAHHATRCCPRTYAFSHLFTHACLHTHHLRLRYAHTPYTLPPPARGAACLSGWTC